MKKEQSVPSFRSLSREERRERIVWAAKRVFTERGFDATNMDDVAAVAGTTKPTVYAHFETKEALFSAVVELIRRLYLEKLKAPGDYADKPIEAISRFCRRFQDLATWREAIGFQRMALGTTDQRLALTRAVYETVYGEACRALAEYLRKNKLTKSPDLKAELLLFATTGGAILRHLFGVDEPRGDLPGKDSPVAAGEIKALRAIVERILNG